jgi:hypothetical protein
MDLLAKDNRDLPSPEVLDKDFLAVVTKASFIAPKRLRWREEDGFWLVSVRGATVYDIDIPVASFLRKQQALGTPFDLKSFPGRREELARLVRSWIVERADNTALHAPRPSDPTYSRVQDSA